MNQHNESPNDTWEPREYDLNRTYAKETAAWSPYLTRLPQANLRETEEKNTNEKKRQTNKKIQSKVKYNNKT